MASILIYFVFGVFVKDVTVSAFAVSSTEKVYALNGGNASFRILFTPNTNEVFDQFEYKCNGTVMRAPDYYIPNRPSYSGSCYRRYRRRCHTDLEPGKNDFTITVLNVSSVDEGQCSLEVSYHKLEIVSSFSQLVVGNTYDSTESEEVFDTTNSTGSGRVGDTAGRVYPVVSSVAYNHYNKTATFTIDCRLNVHEVMKEVFFKYKGVNVFEVRPEYSDEGKFFGFYQRRGSSTYSPGINDFTITLSDVTSADEGQYRFDVTIKSSYTIVSYSQLVISVKPTGTPPVNTETPTVKTKPSSNQSVNKVPPVDTKTTSLSGNTKDGVKPATGSMNTAPPPDTGANKSGSGKGAVSADRASKFLPCVSSVVMAMIYTTG